MSTRNEPIIALLNGTIDTPSLYLKWSEAPWDTIVFGHPVLKIDNMEVRGRFAASDIEIFTRAREKIDCRLVSSRLNHECLAESMLLEDVGFRFIEMIYQPELEKLAATDAYDEPGLSVALATMADMPEVLKVAGNAYSNDRIHMDPRLPSAVGDLRYQNWVSSTISHPSQRLSVLRDDTALVAFFITESLADGTCYWHLNAVAPEAQGRGYGKHAWMTMLRHAWEEGAIRIRTSIAARNHRVLNLYAGLGFKFSPPMMTFHWVHKQ